MSNTTPVSSNPDPVTLSPETVIAQLRTMESQINEVAPLSKEQRALEYRGAGASWKRSFWRPSAVWACWIAHQSCTGAGVELSPPAAGSRGVYTPRVHINRKNRRVAETSSRWPLALVDKSVTSPPA